MELDTGASVSIISHCTYFMVWPISKCLMLRLSNTWLHTYLGKVIDILGSIDATSIYGAQKRQLSMVILPTDGPSVIRQDCFKQINLHWRQLHHTQEQFATMIYKMC